MPFWYDLVVAPSLSLLGMTRVFASGRLQVGTDAESAGNEKWNDPEHKTHPTGGFLDSGIQKWFIHSLLLLC